MKRLFALLTLLALVLALLPVSVYAAGGPPDGHCPQHPNASIVYKPIRGTYTYINPSTHSHVWGVTPYCSVCGKEIFMSACTDYYDTEPHTFDSYGVCACGYTRDGKIVPQSQYVPKTWPDGPMVWYQYLVNHNFPQRVIQDRSSMCSQKGGTLIERLAITSQKGSNLRSSMSYTDNKNLIRTLHANTTVFVYFSLHDGLGREWYYVVCDDGTEGYLLAMRIQLAN